MLWLLILWFACFFSPAFGNRHGHPVTVKKPNFANFPIDLMTASTSAVQKTNPSKMKLDEDRKTLSQQVADGKYGLIQQELFTNPVARPGVLSYDNNSEVPKDNVNNLGGLNKSDIWLAENHLLVLKGGVYPLIETIPEYTKPAWPPIDDYDAPRRQVKLPKHPKVPPPFPVQLTDGGPIQILGTNFTRTINDSLFSPPYAVPSLEGYDPGNGPIFPPAPYPYPPNATSGETPFPAPPYPPAIQGAKPEHGAPPPQSPFPINGGLPPFFDSLPPGSAILPPPNNLTDQFDEDDLSIYYPPPYSFYYPKDNSTEVPPGPLVPGIVLPPPPDFFGLLAKPSPTTPTSRPTTTTYPSTTPLVPTELTTSKTRKPDTSKTKTVTSKPTTRTKPVYHTTSLPGLVDKKPQSNRNKTISVTVLRPIKPPTRKPSIYIYDNTVPNKPFEEYGPPPPPTRHRGRITITTTKVPLRAYFTTTNEIDKNLVTRIPEIEQYTTRSSPQKQRSKQPTQIYYYDDAPLTNSISTPYPVLQSNRYINLTKDYYRKPEEGARKYSPKQPFVQVQQTPTQPQYFYLPSKTYITQRPQNKILQQTLSPNHFKTHILKLQEQIQSYQRPPKQQYKETVYDIQNTNQALLPPKPVYKQNLFDFQNNNNQNIQSSRPVYKQTIYKLQNDNHEIPSPKPVYNQNVFQIQDEIPSSKPVYQYSFEVANYREQHDKFQVPTVSEHTRQGKVRNLPKYTVQLEPAVEITTTKRPIYQNTVPSVYYQEDFNAPRKYYTNNVPDYHYQEQQYTSASVTPHPIEDQTYTVTPNPVYQTYYTKQDEQYFDDITKKYFTTFGKKIPTSTTPIPTIEAPTNHRQIVYSQPEENTRIRTNRPSYFANSALRGDVVVNYVNEAPPQNIHHPQYVQLKQPTQPYPQVSKQVPQFAQVAQAFLPQINENYRKKIPKNNIQTIQAISIPAQGEGKPGSFISYELPGDDGAHFYFLTPQLTQKDNRGDIAYYYTPQSNPRIRRNS
ncbi:hypothetical protein ILUMI_01813 [Ignelater luminosus]|uniref:Uncharacterized protein n=1 Tax=Ignelater luminosus TaxID=2038154 RepID=A0A8K0DDP5_IGNLU|nr:hypothetical protein ILUMI_01813 [Ignelater luminosus]